MNEITPEEFARLFPNASASTIRRNKAAAQSVRIATEKSVQSAVRQSHSPSKPKMLATPGTSEMERRLNKTEKRFLARLRIDPLYREEIGIQDVTLRLGFDLRYTPDFRAMNHTGHAIFFEVKGGFEREDAAVKIKMAAAKFPFWTFIKAVWKDGQWTETVVRP